MKSWDIFTWNDKQRPEQDELKILTHWIHKSILLFHFLCFPTSWGKKKFSNTSWLHSPWIWAWDRGYSHSQWVSSNDTGLLDFMAGQVTSEWHLPESSICKITEEKYLDWSTGFLSDYCVHFSSGKVWDFISIINLVWEIKSTTQCLEIPPEIWRNYIH